MMNINTFKGQEHTSALDVAEASIDSFFSELDTKKEVATALIVESKDGDVVTLTSITPYERGEVQDMFELIGENLTRVTLRMTDKDGTHQTRILSGKDVLRWLLRLDVRRDCWESCARFLAVTRDDVVYTVMDRHNGRGILAFSKEGVNEAYHELMKKSAVPLELSDFETIGYVLFGETFLAHPLIVEEETTYTFRFVL